MVFKHTYTISGNNQLSKQKTGPSSHIPFSHISHHISRDRMACAPNARTRALFMHALQHIRLFVWRASRRVASRRDMRDHAIHACCHCATHARSTTPPPPPPRVPPNVRACPTESDHFTRALPAARCTQGLGEHSIDACWWLQWRAHLGVSIDRAQWNV